MTNETVIISAENGGVGVYIGDDNKVGFAKTAKMLKYILDTKNINVFEDRIFFSSSMDFANEYGFATHDGAKEIFYSAQNMIQDEIVATDNSLVTLMDKKTLDIICHCDIIIV